MDIDQCFINDDSRIWTYTTLDSTPFPQAWSTWIDQDALALVRQKPFLGHLSTRLDNATPSTLEEASAACRDLVANPCAVTHAYLTRMASEKSKDDVSHEQLAEATAQASYDFYYVSDTFFVAKC